MGNQQAKEDHHDNYDHDLLDCPPPLLPASPPRKHLPGTISGTDGPIIATPALPALPIRFAPTISLSVPPANHLPPKGPASAPTTPTKPYLPTCEAPGRQTPALCQDLTHCRIGPAGAHHHTISTPPTTPRPNPMKPPPAAAPSNPVAPPDLVSPTPAPQQSIGGACLASAPPAPFTPSLPAPSSASMAATSDDANIVVGSTTTISSSGTDAKFVWQVAASDLHATSTPNFPDLLNVLQPGTAFCSPIFYTHTPCKTPSQTNPTTRNFYITPALQPPVAPEPPTQPPTPADTHTACDQSPTQPTPVQGDPLKFRLACIVADHNPQYLSLYLQCLSSATPTSPSCFATFSLELTHTAPPSPCADPNCSQPTSTNPTPSDANPPSPRVPTTTSFQNLRHTFSYHQPSWGVQDLLQNSQFATLLASGTLTVTLHLTAIHPQPPSPSAPRSASHPSTTPIPTLIPPTCPLALSLVTPHQQPPQIFLVSDTPRIVLVDNFLDPDLCQALADAASPRLVRSKVSSGTETLSRTSWSMFFTGDSAREALVQEVERRIEALVAIPQVRAGRPPLAKTEALQVVKYHPSEFYAEHYDNKVGATISRAATVIIYLTDVQEGGATFFPRSTGLANSSSPARRSGSGSWGQRRQQQQQQGLRVFPCQGRAILFWSKLLDGGEDLASIHAGEKVVVGEKWIATRWLKEA